MIRHTRGFVKSLVVAAAIGMTLFAGSPGAAAISSAQRDALNSGILYYNTEDSMLCTSSSNTVSGTLPGTVPEPYNTIFTSAASALGTNPQFVAVLFLDEHHNTWPNPAGPWATSQSAGAEGPFQFLLGTWDNYKTDGNNDGVLDIQNLDDAAYTAANWLVRNGVTAASPLGDINQPFANQNSMLYKAAAYNWGGGAVQKYTTVLTQISDPLIPVATQNYVKNTYTVISSGFTQGDSSYGAIQNQVGDTAGTTDGLTGNLSTGCSAGVVAGSIVQTALNLSWSDGRHGLSPKPEYTAAIQQFDPTGFTSFQGADCGAFVATVMHASGADTSYPGLGTSVQEQYMINHPEKYAVVHATITSELAVGDIFIINANGGAGADGHTFIYTGPQPNGTTMAEASEGDQMPFQGNVIWSDSRGTYDIYRLKS